MIKISKDIPEIITIIAIILGFTIAIFTPNKILLYTLAFLSGLLFGKTWQKYQKSQCVPMFLIIIGFFLGFVIGGIYANIRIITLMLLAGILISYWIHEKKIIKKW